MRPLFKAPHEDGFWFHAELDSSQFIQQSNLNKTMKTNNMTTPYLTNSISRSPLRRAFCLIAVALACFGLSRAARAACRQGCDTFNANTFLGDFALVNNTFGTNNTAVGSFALESNTTAGDNTAIGFEA